MRVCFLTLGSRGDVQPYVALAKHLIKHGHQAVICTGASFRRFIEANGIEYANATLDLMALASTTEGKAILEAPLKHIRLVKRFSAEVILPAYRKTIDDFFAVAQGADMLVYHPKAIGAVDIAESLGIPCISMPPVPVTYPVTEFPHLGIFPTANFGKAINRLTYYINQKAEMAQLKAINHFRAETLNLPARNAGAYTLYRNGKEIPTVYPVSPSLFSDVQSWQGHVFLSGFFFLDAETQLDPAMEAFLSRGKKPIAVTFSSMPLKKPDSFIKKLESALIDTDNRAVILTGNSGMPILEKERIYVAQQAPHDLLFAKSLGVVHHGGVGTMAAALRAGIPQLMMPFSVDQPFWANRLYKMGFALKPLREKSLTAASLSEAFSRMADENTQTKAEQLGRQIKLEQGMERARQYLEYKGFATS